MDQEDAVAAATLKTELGDGRSFPETAVGHHEDVVLLLGIDGHHLLDEVTVAEVDAANPGADPAHRAHVAF